MWKLHVVNEDENIEPTRLEDELWFPTKEAALIKALQYWRDPAKIHSKCRYIEGPGGGRIEQAEIEEWCRRQP